MLLLSAVVVSSMLPLAAAPLLRAAEISPGIGVTVWMTSLLLRASLVAAAVILTLVWLPETALFNAVTHWCLHAVLPLLATHLGFDGHSLGRAAVGLPVALLVLSVASASVAVCRGGRAVKGWLHRNSLGAGPQHSMIVSGGDVLVAAAGVRAPKVIVSTGALVKLDDEELAAGLQHEWGHVKRRHPSLLLVARILCAIGRPLPGGRSAFRNLQFHLERDADEYSVQRTGDPLALASAICKAAPPLPDPLAPAAASLAGCGVPQRLQLLLNQRSARSPRSERLARGVALLAVASTLGLLVAMPAAASQAPAAHAHVGYQCS
jgi:hypothetical protein